MRKNVASQVVAFQAISATDGSAVTSGTPTVYYTIDGGTQGTGTATPVHEGNGQWSWVPTQAETNGNHIAYTFVLTGCISQCINVYTVSFDPHDAVRLGLTALPNAAADAAGGLVISDSGGLNIDAMNTNVSAILVDTGTDIPNALVTIDTVVDAILVDTGTDIPTLINTVDNVVDQILADTGTDGVVVAAGSKTGYTLTATTGLGNQTANITGTITTATNVTTVNGLAANVITAASIATDAIDADALAADAIAEINATVDTALADIHLDHLLATDYDPASKPGVATALLNELIESNAGVSRYTAAALAQAPSGTGGDATAANQTTILNHLTDIKGGTFSGATDSLEAIRDRGDSAWTTGAGGSDRLLMVDTTIATLGSQTSFTLTSGSADNDAYNGCTIVIEDASTATQKAVGVVSDYVGSTRTVTLVADPAVFTMAASDKVYILAERSVKSASATLFTINCADIASEASLGSVASNVTSILGELPTNFADLAITASTGRVTVGTNADKTGYSLTATTGLGNQTANITGNLSGSVGSVTGGINTAAGVITTLDGLDTAQDSQHTTTQALVSSSAIATSVWNAATASYGSSGSYGLLVESLSAAGDPWSVAIPGAYVAGTAGYIVGTYLDAQVSSVSGGGAGLYTVTVTVADSNGDALQGARVNVDGTTQTLTTLSNGIVTFNLDAGSYSLVVSPPAGYQTPANTSITVSADASTTITLTAGSSGVGWLG